MEIQFRALRQWPKQPTPSNRRKRSQFSAKYSDTLQTLERELEHLNAKAVVIEADCEEREIRRDGHLRSDARLRGPGIVLRFEGKAGSMTFPCDTFTDWQDNLRAIALALESLRKVDRYGVTSSGEQYRGWAALPDKSQAGAFQTQEAAMAWMVQTVGPMPQWPWDNDDRQAVRRQAVMRCHPDRNCGNDSTWKFWLQAAAMLGIEV